MELALSIALTVSAAFGFFYGLNAFFGKESSLYARMIVFAVGCAMLSWLFETLQLLSFGEIRNGFQVGDLGIIGSSFFFLGANYGEMDALADDKSKALRKYRWIPVAASLVIAGLYNVYFAIASFSSHTVVNAAQTVILSSAAYYHLKHLIIPDVEDGLIRSIRPFNLVALIYDVLCACEAISTVLPKPGVYRYIVTFALCVVLIVMIPVLKKGVYKWTI